MTRKHLESAPQPSLHNLSRDDEVRLLGIVDYTSPLASKIVQNLATLAEPVIDEVMVDFKGKIKGHRLAEVREAIIQNVPGLFEIHEPSMGRFAHSFSAYARVACQQVVSHPGLTPPTIKARNPLPGSVPYHYSDDEKFGNTFKQYDNKKNRPSNKKTSPKKTKTNKLAKA